MKSITQKYIIRVPDFATNHRVIDRKRHGLAVNFCPNQFPLGASISRNRSGETWPSLCHPNRRRTTAPPLHLGPLVVARSNS